MESTGGMLESSAGRAVAGETSTAITSAVEPLPSRLTSRTRVPGR